MKNTIDCPNCQHKIEIAEVLRAQITANVRGEMAGIMSAHQSQLEADQKRIEDEKRCIEQDRKSIEEQVAVLVASQKEQLTVEAEKQAYVQLDLELRDRDSKLTELESQLITARSNELVLRKRERDLESQKQELELQVARQLDQERAKLRAEAKQQFEDQYLLREADKDKTIADLLNQLKEMQRKAQQGSQQLQGEVQEIALQELLTSTFALDAVQQVPKGVCGGDCIQTVVDTNGRLCGSILWESKRTKNWSNTWLAKARDDQRAAESEYVIIVSETLPEGVRNFARIEGVWVCGWQHVSALATALRFGLFEIAKARAISSGRNEKTELVYNYLSSTGFQQRVAGIVEAFVSMQTHLESEKRSMKRIWSCREKQISRAVTNTACLYGDLQGIIGSSLPAIDGLQPRFLGLGMDV